MLYAYDSSREYNPAPHLGRIEAPVVCDQLGRRPGESAGAGVLEREIKQVKRGRFILIPTSEKTRGHGTHSMPAIWGEYLGSVAAGIGRRRARRCGYGIRSSHFGAVRRRRSTVSKLKPQKALSRWRSRAAGASGADRFYHLVETGFYDDSRFYRVIRAASRSFGIPGAPGIAASGETSGSRTTVRASNVRGSFAYAMTGPSARTTQIYINTGDQSRQDGDGFAPIGKVIEGMEVVDNLYSGYGENSGGGMRAGRQGKLFGEGNAYLDSEFPLLDRLVRARIVRLGRARRRTNPAARRPPPISNQVACSGVCS